jgi:uncharacterized protein (DUF1800 family)
MRTTRLFALAAACSLAAMLAGCGGSSSTSTNVLPSQATVAVSVTPSGSQVRAGSTQQFTATVTGTSNTAVTWSVNGVVNGNATVGTISAAGVYSAPATVPANNTINVSAVSTADPTKSASVTATLLNAVPTVAAVIPAVIDTGSFTITIRGTGFVAGTQTTLSGAALTTTVVSGTVLRASGTATASQAGTTLSLTVTNPNPGSASSTAASVPVGVVTAAAAARFLEQSTFGPTPASIAHVQQVGFDAFLTEQFGAAPSTYADPNFNAPQALTGLQAQWLQNALTGQDQLRQRVAFALHQIWVISGLTVTTDAGFVPYLRILSNRAFGNYFDVMHDITLNPAMGKYLDMVNNDKPVNGAHANENYGRELMQLFTIGLVERNADYSVVRDGSGNPVPTYTQDQVQEMSRALTGWTYPLAAGATQQLHNREFYGGTQIMVAVESNHDTGAKNVLRGAVLPAGQTAAQDLDGALQNIFNDPSLAPFVVHNLIQHLVTSNPSPQYMGRIVAVFNNNGQGVRGDLRAVVRAILLDAEARRGDTLATAGTSDGHLREPVLFITSVLRSLGATVVDSASLANNTVANVSGFAGQRILYSPSVFNYYPPDYVVPATDLLGPEFDLQTTANAQVRANFINTVAAPNSNAASTTPYLTATGQPAVTIDVSNYAALAGTPNVMLDAMDYALMHGQMSAAMRQSITSAVTAIAAGNTAQRARAAAYLIFTSSQYQFQH